MEWYWAFAFLLGMVICFMALGVPVAFAFIATNFIAVYTFTGFDFNALIQVADNSTQLISRFTLGPVPMFILMGSLFFHTGLALKVFRRSRCDLRPPARPAVLSDGCRGCYFFDADGLVDG